jgi:hypothetical protein
MCFLIATLALVIALLVGSLIAPQSSNGHRRSEDPTALGSRLN